MEGNNQPYSVRDMLAQDVLANHFDGAIVFQAFLSALSFHRWRAPVSGIVIKAFVHSGTHCSDFVQGIGNSKHAAEGSIEESAVATSQGYLTYIATRAIILIEADNPVLGLMAFIGVVMAEVSTCYITVKEGQRVLKGEEAGMSHFGEVPIASQRPGLGGPGESEVAD